MHIVCLGDTFDGDNPESVQLIIVVSRQLITILNVWKTDHPLSYSPNQINIFGTSIRKFII